jgi:hypothetical protein
VAPAPLLPPEFVVPAALVPPEPEAPAPLLPPEPNAGEAPLFAADVVPALPPLGSEPEAESLSVCPPQAHATTADSPKVNRLMPEQYAA